MWHYVQEDARTSDRLESKVPLRDEPHRQVIRLRSSELYRVDNSQRTEEQWTGKRCSSRIISRGHRVLPIIKLFIRLYSKWACTVFCIQFNHLKLHASNS